MRGQAQVFVAQRRSVREVDRMFRMILLYVIAAMALIPRYTAAEPLSLERWGIVVLAGGSLFAIEETRKVLFPRLFSLGKWKPVRRIFEVR